MYLIVLVINDPDRLEELLISWEDAGISGVTVMFSTGMGRIRQLQGWRDDMPLIPSLRDFYEAPENLNRTIFATANDDTQVDAIVAATQKVIGNLDDVETGFLLVLPVARAYGANKRQVRKP